MNYGNKGIVNLTVREEPKYKLGDIHTWKVRNIYKKLCLRIKSTSREKQALKSSHFGTANIDLDRAKGWLLDLS